MAMTLKSSPAKIGTAFNDLIFVVDSTNKTSVNYKYICDVYINSVRIARLKNNPNPNFTNFGIFNVNKVVQSYVNSDYFSAAPILKLINPYIAYQVKFSERYETAPVPETIISAYSPGGEVTNNDVIVDAVKYAYNTSYAYTDASIFYGATTNENILHRKFITNRPRLVSVPDLSDLYITGYTAFPDLTITFSLRLTTYTGLNQTGTPSVSTWPAAITNANDFILNAGTKGLQNAGVSLSGIQSYKFDLMVDGVVADTINFNIDICEPKHSINHFVFMNRMGGFESVYFTKASRKRVEVDRKTMLSQSNKYNSGTFKVDTIDANNTFYEGFKTYGAKYNDKLKVNTDWLTDAEYSWLTDLITSGVIYVQQTIPASIGVTQTDVYVPCRITNKEYEINKKVNSKLTQLELEFELGFNNYIQVR